MHRLLFLLSLPPLLLAVILRKINADRILKETSTSQLSRNAAQLAEDMLDAAKEHNAKVQVARPSWIGNLPTGKNRLTLTPVVAAEKNGSALGYAALHVGLLLLDKHNPSTLAKLRWATRFGHVFPIFTTIVAIFAIAVAKLPPLMGIGVIAASLALATLAQILSVIAKLQAAELATVLLEKSRLIPRLSDEEAVTAATRAWAWHAVLPGIISRLVK
ncbi:MAG: zinc metallopeptidase [Akkermansiaceae bacterium]